MLTKIGKTLLIALFPLLTSAVAYGADAAPEEVVEVVIIDQQDASEPFAAMFEKFSAAYAANDSPGERSMWAAVYAGQNSNSIIVYIVYPSIEALAADKTVSSPEYQALVPEFVEKGFKVSSRMLNFRVR